MYADKWTLGLCNILLRIPKIRLGRQPQISIHPTDKLVFCSEDSNLALGKRIAPRGSQDVRLPSTPPVLHQSWRNPTVPSHTAFIQTQASSGREGRGRDGTDCLGAP